MQSDIREWRRRAGLGREVRSDSEGVGRLLAAAYPDRVAQRRAGQAGRFLLRNGRGAAIPPDQPLARADYIVAADLDDTGAESRVLLAAPLDRSLVDELVDPHGGARLPFIGIQPGGRCGYSSVCGWAKSSWPSDS